MQASTARTRQAALGENKQDVITGIRFRPWLRIADASDLLLLFFKERVIMSSSNPTPPTCIASQATHVDDQSAALMATGRSAQHSTAGRPQHSTAQHALPHDFGSEMTKLADAFLGLQHEVAASNSTLLHSRKQVAALTEQLQQLEVGIAL
jgi:hypothetical protein